MNTIRSRIYASAAVIALAASGAALAAAPAAVAAPVTHAHMTAQGSASPDIYYYA